MRPSTPQLRVLVLGGAAVAGLVLAGLSAGAPRLSDGGKLLDNFPHIGKSVQPIINRLTKINGILARRATPVPTRPPPSHTWVNIFELAVLGLVILGIIWFLIVPAVRSVDWSALRLPPEPLEDELEEALVTPEAAEQLARDLSRLMGELGEGDDPRHAVLGCWVALEEAVARAGVPRRPAESSLELTNRVLAAYDVDGRALDRLHGLYRAARFSGAPVDEAARRDAHAALAVLHDAIEAPGPPSGLPEEPTFAGLAP